MEPSTKTQLSPQPGQEKWVSRFLAHLLSVSILPGPSSIHLKVGQNLLSHKEIVHSHSTNVLVGTHLHTELESKHKVSSSSPLKRLQTACRLRVSPRKALELVSNSI